MKAEQENKLDFEAPFEAEDEVKFNMIISQLSGRKMKNFIFLII